MAWTITNATAAANKRLLDHPYAPNQATAATVVVEGNKPTRMGVYSGGRFRQDTSDVRQERDTTLDLNEVAEVFVPGVEARTGGLEGYYAENGEPYVNLDDTHKTMITIEVLAVPTTTTQVNISLTYKETAAGGLTEFRTVVATFTADPADTLGEINVAMAEAIYSRQDSWGNEIVSSWQEWRQSVGRSDGAREDALFSAWMEDPTVSGYETLFFQALTHRQDFAHIEVAQSVGGPDFLVTTFPARLGEPTLTGPGRMSLRANKLRDTNYTVASAMRQGDISAQAEGSYRLDVDVQGVRLRSKQGAEQNYEGLTAQSEGGGTDRTTVRFNPEVVSYGVHRTAIIELDWSWFTASTNLIQEETDLITVQLPWPDEDYYVEGSAILVDAFIEVEEVFAELDGGSQPVRLAMDFGAFIPDLWPTGEGQPLMNHTASIRGYFSSVLRSVPVDTAPNSGRYGINVLPKGPEWMACGIIQGGAYEALDTQWLWWDQDGDSSTFIEGAGLVPSMGPFTTDVIVQGYSVQYQHAGTALTTSMTTGDEFYTRIKVCAPGVAAIDANFQPIEQVLPGSGVFYQWTNDGKIYLDAAGQGGAPGAEYKNLNLGFRLPAGWRMAVELTYPTNLGLVPADSHFKCTVNMHRHSIKGDAFQNNPQTLVISPYTDDGYLFATLSREAAYELGEDWAGGYAPGTDLMTSLGSTQAGKVWVHLHFWQHDSRVPLASFGGSSQRLNTSGGSGGTTYLPGQPHVQRAAVVSVGTATDGVVPADVTMTIDTEGMGAAMGRVSTFRVSVGETYAEYLTRTGQPDTPFADLSRFGVLHQWDPVNTTDVMSLVVGTVPVGSTTITVVPIITDGVTGRILATETPTATVVTIVGP
jgi:hypothetical protein